MKHTDQLPALQRRLIAGYLASLCALCASIALMPTKLLVRGGIYGHSILFWLSVLCAVFCYSRFKRSTAERSQGTLCLCRSRQSKYLLLLTVAALALFLLLQSAISSLARFLLFAVCVFLLGLYLGANSYAYHIYRKHRQVRRDENE